MKDALDTYLRAAARGADHREAVRAAGEQIAEHKAPGEITVQCLEGCVKFTVDGRSQELTSGDMLYLEAAKPHAVEAVKDSSVLVTILLNKAS